MSLLSIIQKTTDRLSLQRPSVVVTSTDQQVRQLFALANEEGEALSKRGAWQALVSEHAFVTSAAEEQTNSPTPSDLRAFVPNTFYNRTQARALVGPITPQQYQAIKSQSAYASVYLAFRRRHGSFLITPPPPAGETIAYEYVSAFWAKSDAGVAKAEFTADTDMTYLDEELIIQGLRWRYLKANGLEYGEDLMTYERSVEVALSASSGASALNIGGSRTAPLEHVNLPEGNFGV